MSETMQNPQAGTTASDDATAEMVTRWSQFALHIAADAEKPNLEDRRVGGELIVLGSGLAHIDLLLNDETLIKSADYVFHCLYDRVTQVWISTLRPDALDLRILYDAQTDRHATYVCMAEAMLYHVRRGHKVVAIYYGHPGIFATPTHRAIQIARQEGHGATMRPGISALDYLIADVGFDPMIPGLLSYEASDLLIRRRRLDPQLHTVLWQVGVVGEFQYSARGFANHGFPMLVQTLRSYYGGDWEVVHYIAPQYVGVDALIMRHTVDELESSEVRSSINAMSTFYIPPRNVAPIDRETAVTLGFMDPDAPLAEAEPPFDLKAYGGYERGALARFGAFQPDAYYSLPARSPATDFMLAISRDPELLKRYRTDPADVLADPAFADLTDRARALLAIPHPMAINAALAEPAAGQVGSIGHPTKARSKAADSAM